MLLGHQEVVEALTVQLPPVSILIGPPSVGKRLIAAHAAMANNIARYNFMEVSRLTVEEAHKVKSFMLVHPNKGLKFALINLDSASSQAINHLLKFLEQPPDYARLSLISSHSLPDVLMTRGYKYSVGLLKPDELFSILISKGVPEQQALQLNRLGRVDIAMQSYLDVATRTAALSVLQSVETGDYELFCQAYKAVDEKVAAMVIAILEESAAQNWKLFNPEFLGVFKERKIALAVISAWSNVASAKPQLAVRSALESIMRG